MKSITTLLNEALRQENVDWFFLSEIWAMQNKREYGTEEDSFEAVTIPLSLQM